MGSRVQSHQLSNGLYVSGPKQTNERMPTMSSVPVPYTGGDIKRSGELGKMFNLPVDGSKSGKAGLIGAPTRTGSFGGAASHSGSVNSNAVARSSYSTSGHVPPSMVSGSASMKKANSGPLNKHGEPIKKSAGSQSGVTRQNLVPLPPVLPATGLITSGPLNSSGAPRRISGPLDSSGPVTIHGSSLSNNPGVTTLGQADEYSVPKPILYALILLFVMGFIAGVYVLESIHNSVLVVAVFILFCIVGGLFMWNSCWGRKAAVNYIASYPNSELRTAENGQYVKVSGVVTCGNVPLISSFEKVPGCVYTSTSLYECRTWISKAANSTLRRFTWGIRATEKHVVDFYITDSRSGLRALVKTGYGARVTPYVDESVVIDVDPHNKDSCPEFIQWLGERNLSFDDRVMQLKEGLKPCAFSANTITISCLEALANITLLRYIKEGSTVSVMGVVQRNENVLMIVPPPETITTGCQWTRCIFPARFEGVVLRCDDSLNPDVIV